MTLKNPWLIRNASFLKKKSSTKIFWKKNHPKLFFRCRKMKRWESSETRFGQVSRRSEPSSRGKRPFKVSKKFDPENFKRPKNREDSSNFDDCLTKTIAPTRSRFQKHFARRSRRKRRKTSRKHRKTSRTRRARWHGGAVKIRHTAVGAQAC